jgi:hypothetical protein
MKNGYIKIVILCIFIICVFSNCEFAEDYKITEKYHLIAVDIGEDMSLCFSSRHEIIIDQTVFAVGFNENYIIVKQHPYNNRTITNYYIVPIYKEETLFPEKGILGPLTLEQFNEKKKELKLLKVKFTKVIKS